MTKPVAERLTPSRQRLALRIRVLRAIRGWSQETLGELAGIHRTYISTIEQARGNVSLETLDKLARALDTTAAALLAEDRRSGDYARALADID